MISRRKGLIIGANLLLRRLFAPIGLDVSQDAMGVLYVEPQFSGGSRRYSLSPVNKKATCGMITLC